MDIPPCTEGKHSATDKPPEIESKPHTTDSALLEKLQNIEPAFGRIPIAPVNSTATPPPPASESEDDDTAMEIPDGKICRRKGCGQSFRSGQSRDGEKCVFHPGAPIFHEGSKGYSCCKRRVLEFDQFMKIEGCKTKSRHLFIGSGKDSKEFESRSEDILQTVRHVTHELRFFFFFFFFCTSPYVLTLTPRHDFYQTPASVIASFFLKKINKDKAKVEFKSKQLVLDLVTMDQVPKRYRAEVPLFAAINPKSSSFKIFGTKLEVSLAKSDGQSWPVLRGDDKLTGEIFQVGRAGRA